MSHNEVEIRVDEGEFVSKIIVVEVEDENGVKTPYDFTNKTVEFRIKKSNRLADADPSVVLYTLANGRVAFDGAATAGRVRVSFQGTDIATPGVYRWTLKAIVNAQAETLLKGPLVVEAA